MCVFAYGGFLEVLCIVILFVLIKFKLDLYVFLGSDLSFAADSFLLSDIQDSFVVCAYSGAFFFCTGIDIESGLN